MIGRRNHVAAISALLVLLLAACSDGSQQPDSLSPTISDAPEEGVVAAPLIAVRNFQIDYRLEGFTAESAWVGLVSNPKLIVDPSVADGSDVRSGEPIGALKIALDVMSDLQLRAETSKLDADRLQQLVAMEAPLVTPVSGVLDVDRRAILRRGMDVVVPLTPIQSLRYQSSNFSGDASVETVVGDRTVPCEAVWIVTASPSGASTDASADSVTQVAEGDALHCRLPSFVETAAGIRAQLLLSSEPIPDAVVIPNRSIGYDEATDSYYVNIIENPDGERVVKRVDIAVGATDGVVRVVTSSVLIGAELAPIEAD